MSERKVEVPDIGDATDVDVVEVLVTPGTRVTTDQGLIVLESEKASMEVPSPAAGVVKSIAIKVGDKVSKGALILTLESEAAGDAAAKEEPKKKQAAAPTKPAAKQARKPEPESETESETETESDSDAESDSESDSVSDPESDSDSESDSVSDSASGSVESERPTNELPRPRDSEPGHGPTRTIIPPKIDPTLSLEPPRGKKPHAAPSVRRIARELGVDLGHVSGSGPHQRITRDDVQRYVKHAMSVAGTATGTGFAVPELPAIDFSQFGETSLKPLTKIQKLSGRNLHRSWVTIPHVTQFDDADITELEEFRKKMRAERPEVKLTLTSFFMKAVVALLKQMPRFNSSLDPSGENLVLKHYFHIGVAVDTPNGLVVPVIRDVDIKGLHDLAVELSDVSERARARRLAPQDLQGACITISSLGGIGGTHFTPIINPPEVAVLGVSRAALRPAYVDGELSARLMCGLSLSYDHRVIDGADAVRFTTRLREVLSDIRQMLL